MYTIILNNFIHGQLYSMGCRIITVLKYNPYIAYLKVLEFLHYLRQTIRDLVLN